MIEHKQRACVAYALSALGLIVLAVIQLEVAPTVPFTPTLFGHHTLAVFDLWIIGHFILGIIFGGAWQLVTREAFEGPWYLARWFLLAVIMMVIWEYMEFMIEIGVFGEAAARWQGGVEHWTNRYIADIVLATIGCIAFRYQPKILWPTVFIGTAWLLLHLSLKDTMALQNWIVSLTT